MLFGVLADAAEADANLGAEAIDIAHRTNNGVLDAVGVNRILPNTVKNATDSAYDASQNLVLNAGQKTAAFLRTMDGPSKDRQDDEENSIEGEDQESGASSRGPFPSCPDPRDYQYEPPDEPPSLEVDLRQYCPGVYDQGHMMSCTAHAVAGAFEFNVNKLGLPKFNPSRLFIWYHARAMLQDPYAVRKNVGSNLRDAIKSLRKAHGVCSEYDWSYEVGQYNKKTNYFLAGAKAAKKPPALAEKNAHQHVATKYFSITGKNKIDLQHRLIQCLDQGHPFVFGMKTYNLLHNIRKDGHGLKVPTVKDKKNGEHRHSLLAVGYSQRQKMFLVRNSWGSGFGQDGYFYMPYSYLDHCYDFWTIRVVEYHPNQK